MTPATGIHTHVSFEDYRAWNAVNISSLKPLKRTPEHCLWSQTHPRQSDEMAVGSATHMAILEPGRFKEVFYLGTEEYDATTKDGRAKKAAELEAAGTRQLIRRKAGKDAVDADDVQGMVESVNRRPGFRKWIDMPGLCEVSLLWKDPVTGLLCKARFDKLINAKREIILELKTDSDAGEWSFGGKCADLSYHAQADYYCWGHEILTGKRPLHLIMAIENKGPWCPANYTLDDAAMNAGALLWRKWLDDYATCTKDGKWPGYPETVQVLSLPKWAN